MQLVIPKRSLSLRKALIPTALFGTSIYIFCKGRKSKNETIRAGLAGSLGAYLVELLWHPIDTINMRAKAVNASSSCIFLKQLLKKEGILSLYRGIPIVYYAYLPGFFLYFSLYSHIKKSIYEKYSSISEASSSLLAAGISEFMFVCLIYPAELMKTRMQVPKLAFGTHGNMPAISNVSLGTKILANYVGFAPHLTTYISFTCLQFFIYTGIVHYYRKKENIQNEIIPAKWILFASITSAFISSLVSNPLETLTVLNQTQGKVGFKKLLDKKIWFSGLFPRIAYNSILTTSLFFSLEYCAALFNTQFSH